MINFLHSMAIVTYVTFAISGVLPLSACSPMISLIYRPNCTGLSECSFVRNVQ